MQGALVTVTAMQEKKSVKLPVSAWADACIEGVDRADRLGMLVVQQLYFPEMFVEDVGGATMLEADPEAAGMHHQLHIPLFDCNIMIKLAHLLRSSGERKKQGSAQQKCRENVAKARMPHRKLSIWTPPETPNNTYSDRKQHICSESRRRQRLQWRKKRGNPIQYSFSFSLLNLKFAKVLKIKTLTDVL